MAGARKPGPLGRNLEAQDLQDLNDGTLFRGLSPLPRPIGASPTVTHRSLITAAAHTSDVDHLLPQMRAASNNLAPTYDLDRLLSQLRDAIDGIDLQRAAVALLGSQCFSAGVIAGIGVDIITSVVDLLKLGKTLVLAELHDLSTGQVSWWRLVDPNIAPRLLVAKLAGIVFADELRQAAEERDALIRELAEALQNPQELFVGLAKGVMEEYQRDWQEFNAHLKANTLEGRFRAGMIFGQVLVGVLGVITGIGGVAKAAAKLATTLPRLVRYALKFRKKPDLPGTTGSGGGALIGGGNTPQAPLKPVPSTKLPAADAKRPGPPPAEPVSTKPRASAKSPTELQLDEMYAKAPAAKAEIDALADSIAKDIGARPPAKAPLKGRDRALEKAIKDYKGDASRIKDLARNTIIVEDQSQYDKALTLLKQRGADIKTHDATTHPLGYSGTNAFLKTESGLTAEIQVNTPEMIYAKEMPATVRAILGEDEYNRLAAKTGVPSGRSHQLYEEYRSLPEGDPRAADIRREGRAYHDHIRKTGGQ
jgi:hypothetical protein